MTPEHLTPDEVELFALAEAKDRPEGRREHLRGCAACRAEVSFVRALDRRLAALPRVAAAPGLAGRVLARVALPLPWRQRVAVTVRRRGAVAATAAAALLLTGGMSYWLFAVQGLTPAGLAGFVLESVRALAVRGVIAVGQLAYQLGLPALGSGLLAEIQMTDAVLLLAAFGVASLASLLAMARLLRAPAARSLAPQR